MNFGYSFAGFAVGTIVGLTGVGGGSLMTPLLVLFFGIHPATAVGTDLLYAAVTKSGGTMVHAAKGNVDWRVTGLLAAGSLPAAALTLALVARHFSAGAWGALGDASHLISISLGAALFLTALALIFRRRLQALAKSTTTESVSGLSRNWLTVAVGAALGALVSVSSVGAGALGITALLFLYPKLTTQRIVGSDLAHAVPLTLAAGLGHWWLGSVDWALLGSLLAGSLPGIFIASHLGSRVPERVLRPTLAAMLILVAGRLVAQ